MHLLVVLGKLRCRFFVRLKYARFSVFFGLPTTAYRQPSAGAGRPRGKTRKTRKIGFLFSLFFLFPLSLLSFLSLLSLLPPLFTGVFVKFP